MKTLEIETTTIRTNKKILCHHIEIIPNNQSHKIKATEVVHRIQSTEEIHPDPPNIDNTENLELQLNWIHCETTDGENEPENTI